ncbi:MAG: ATP-binding protein [Actinomycetota bacterium]
MAWVAAILAVVIAIAAMGWAVWTRRHSNTRGPTGGGAAASMIAHEMKNPLMAIKGLAATGRRHYDSMSEDERREFFELINEEADRLILIIEQTAMAMRIEARDVEYDVRPETVADLIEEVVERASLGKHPIEIEIEPDLTVRCDRVRTAEVLASLLDNAAKFSPESSPISVRAFRNDRDAVIEVEDLGPGVAPEDRERIFERYASTRPRGYEEIPGAGLSLFISRAHVNAQGGSVRADGAVGDGGTILRLRLPVEVRSAG